MDDRTLMIRISDVLHDIGIPPRIKGYNYLAHAIYLTVKDPQNMYYLTKSLYPVVAEKFDTTPSRVERAMRHAVEVAFNRGNPDTLFKYFGYTVDSYKGKPTNGEFISIMTEWLNLRKDGWNP